MVNLVNGENWVMQMYYLITSICFFLLQVTSILMVKLFLHSLMEDQELDKGNH